jgi:hypothetical protein
MVLQSLRTMGRSNYLLVMEVFGAMIVGMNGEENVSS